MKGLRHDSSRSKGLRLVAIYRLLLAGPRTRVQIIEALGDLYGPNADRALRRDLETLAGRPFAELGCPAESLDLHAVQLHHDRVSDMISLQGRAALVRLDRREWAALDLVARAFSSGAPHAEDVHALIERVRAAAEPTPVVAFPVALSLATVDAVPASHNLLELIEQALRRRQNVVFRYRPRSRREERIFDAVELVELSFRYGHYYLTVYEPGRNQLRELRVDRVVPGSWRLLPRVVASAPRPFRPMVQYRLAAELASGGVSERLTNQHVDWEADGSAVVTGEAHDLFWAARLILGYGSQAEALAPPELRHMVKGEAARMAEFYQSGNGPDDRATG